MTKHHELSYDGRMELARKLHHAERVIECLRMFYDTRDDGEQLDAAVVRCAKLANELAI
jgi:hypothetical protein